MKIVPCLIVAALLVTAPGSCRRPPDEARVRAAIADTARAAHAADAGATVAALSDETRGVELVRD